MCIDCRFIITIHRRSLSFPCLVSLPVPSFCRWWEYSPFSSPCSLSVAVWHVHFQYAYHGGKTIHYHALLHAQDRGLQLENVWEDWPTPLVSGCDVVCSVFNCLSVEVCDEVQAPTTSCSGGAIGQCSPVADSGTEWFHVSGAQWYHQPNCGVLCTWWWLWQVLAHLA